MSPLAELWATLPAGSTVSKLALVNALLVPGPPRDVPISEIEACLSQRGKLAGLYDYAHSRGDGAQPHAFVAASYLTVFLSGSDGPAIPSSDPAINSLVSGFLPALGSDPRTGLDETDLAALAALIEAPIPWWKANGFAAPIGVLDLIEAGYLV